MKTPRLLPWLIFGLAALYFLLPLVGTFEFSLRMLRGQYSFESYRVVFAQPEFREAFARSIVLALITIVVGVVLVVPTATMVRLRAPQLRAAIEFITLLPLVVPGIIIVFGYIRLFNTSSVLPLTATGPGTDLLLACGYVTLSLPYMYRSVDTALRSIDLRTLVEAAESLGAGRLTIILRVVLPNVRTGVLAGAFLAFAIVLGEFTFASLLNRSVFGTYLQLIGANRAYEPAALSVVAFALTWAAMALLQFVGRGPGSSLRRG